MGWSNSQIKDHCVWMYATDPTGTTAEDIRQAAGDFSTIKSVSKYCARFSQCLTQTQEALKIDVGIEKDVVRFEEDIKDPSGKYTFSDGIGRMSPAVAEKICQTLKTVRSTTSLLPCAYQIRYRGCKGMLAVDPRLHGEQIVFRESQRKFHTREFENGCAIEIAKYSQPSQLMLNRPMISILEHLREGIRHGQDVFHELQEIQLMTMSEMLLYEEVALKQLKVKSHVSLGYEKLSGNGVSFTTEPFFRGMLLAINRKANLNLAEKARIEIPPEYGRNFLGVLDETRQLRYGEVFIQYSVDIDKPREHTRVLRGRVIVTKNPCLHPGDVRVFNAVDIPELHHLVDVIAFPQRGHRPHTDEMGGSDLDGDEYQAMWLKDLIFQRNEQPMDFPKPDEQIHQGQIEVLNMIQWFKSFVDSDQLGIIGNAHMAHVDQHGLKSDVCLSLARKFSFAVDFQKTGYIEKIASEEKVKSYPDFMGKHYNTHRSDRILGQLYRKANHVEQLSAASNQHKPEVHLDHHLVHPDWMDFFQVACRDRDAYFQELQDLMAQYGVFSESELISGNLLHMNMVLMEKNELYDTERVLRLHVSDLRRRYREQFREEFGLIGTNELKQKMLAKASAYYAVTYDQKIQKPNRTGLLSFPWLAVDEFLSELKSHHGSKVHAPLSRELDSLIFRSRIPNLLSREFQQFLQKTGRDSEQMWVLLNVLIKWAREYNLLHRSSALDPNVVAALVVKCYEDEDLQLENNREESVGYVCLKVIQHWASQKFRNHGVRLNQFFLNYLVPQPYYTSIQVRYLHIAAFDTFHTIAVSGKFCALRAIQLPTFAGREGGRKQGMSDVGEFRRFQIPLSHSEHHFCCQAFKKVEVHDAKLPGLIGEKIKNVTGMKSVEIRMDVQKNVVQWYVSGYGSFRAKEMLKEMLVSKDIFMESLTKDLSGSDIEEMIAKLTG